MERVIDRCLLRALVQCSSDVHLMVEGDENRDDWEREFACAGRGEGRLFLWRKREREGEDLL